MLLLLLLSEEWVLGLHHGWLSTGDRVPRHGLLVHLIERIVSSHLLLLTTCEGSGELIVHWDVWLLGWLVLLSVEATKHLIVVLVSTCEWLA